MRRRERRRRTAVLNARKWPSHFIAGIAATAPPILFVIANSHILNSFALLVYGLEVLALSLGLIAVIDSLWAGKCFRVLIASSSVLHGVAIGMLFYVLHQFLPEPRFVEGRLGGALFVALGIAVLLRQRTAILLALLLAATSLTMISLIAMGEEATAFDETLHVAIPLIVLINLCLARGKT